MKYQGMTVNERLFVSGLINKFDKAVRKKDINKVRIILNKVELDDKSINPILIQLGLIEKEIS
jgi:hypothetical protein